MSEYPSTPKPAPDGLLVTPVWTTVTTPFDAMTEQRKAKQVFAKYDVSLKYPEGLTNADIQTLWAFYMARRGAYQAFYIYDLISQAHAGLYVGWGDGETTIFDLPGKTTSGQAVYKDGVAVDLSAAGASGSVTLANMRLSLVNGTAFADFSAAGVLTPFLNHKLTITDSAGKKAIGYIKAAGTGETLDSELVTNGDFETGDPPTGWSAGANTTLAQAGGGQSGNCISLYNSLGAGAAASCSRAISTVVGALYKASRYVKDGTASTNGSNFILYKAAYAAVINSTGTVSTSGSWVNAGFYAVGVDTAPLVYLYKSAGADGTILFDTVSVKQVLTPSATGVTITSTAGGTTYNWASIESGFNYNDSSGYTYEISAGVVLDGGGAEDSDRISFSVPPALGVLITCDLTGYLRMRVRFKEDKFNRQSLTHLISSGGTIELKGLSPEDL